ncbi:GspH/FimT family pseudopilin [Dyella subtropica]|uniref:GspH/FimT family pseudopilin n=1 Tax=Dyella subtropica TaxID=2992127 RepID=UPI00224F43E1|nr:GspH/FimT family pseudopilin [Dyella subtropica]
MGMRPQHGYTAVELMVTLGVLAIILMIAAPQMGPFLRKQQVKNASMDITSAVALARSEAVKRNAPVYVVASNAGWTGGWTVNTTGTVLPASSSSTLRAQASMDGINITESNSHTQFNFGGDGRLQSTGMSFTVNTSIATTGVTPLCVNVGATGRVQTTNGGC